MGRLFVCNTSSDNISVVNISEFKEENKISLKLSGMDKVGPHGICTYNNKLIISNNYSNTISIVDIKEGKEIESHFIGMHCNDAVVYENKAYVICGESNYVMVFNLNCKKLEEEIPCGNLPHSIDINKKKKLMLISNFESNSITVLDLEDKKNIIQVRVGAYPTKALFTVDGEHILVCESNMGADIRGNISILSLKNFRLLNKILVGKYPVDMYLNTSYCFVSNFGDGSVSQVDINNYKEIKKINVGGMPRGIINVGEYIYVGDNYNNLLIRAHVESENKRVISIGGEPTGMTYV